MAWNAWPVEAAQRKKINTVAIISTLEEHHVDQST
jgi:hypothetical protein